MTRKDYVALAKVIRAHVDEIREAVELQRVPQETRIRRLTRDLLPILKADNRNFSADRFLAACGFDATEGY